MMRTDRSDDAQRPKQTILGAPYPVPSARSGRSSPRARLYCLPHAGGTARVFRTWQQLLRTHIDVCALDYPGHGTRICQPLLDSIEHIAHAVADEIMSRPQPAPYALLGHSMGSLAAFETCHILTARRAALPSLLIACGHRAPRLPSSSPSMHDAPHAEFVAHLKELGATPSELFSAPDLLELVLPGLRTDFRACETFSPQDRAPLPIPIVVYGGLGDKDTNRERLHAWQEETAGACTVRMFPGGHFFVSDCANQVVAALERDIFGTLAKEPKASCAATR